MKKLIIFLLAAMAAVTAISCGSKVEPEGGAGSGTSEPEVPQPQPKPQLEGNIKGKVTDAVTGAPIAGVSVSDGYTVVTTNADGNYAFYGNELTRTVFISVPAEYEIPTDQNNHPTFYIKGDFSDTEKDYVNNFTLTPRAKVSDKFLLAAGADTHIFDERDLGRFKSETLPDMLTTIAGLNGGGSYDNAIVIQLGDQMSDKMEMVAPYKAAIAGKSVGGRPLPFFHCIGNHDFANSDLEDLEPTSYNASKTYVENFGPLDFSLNIGNAHIIVMNNMVVNEKDLTTRYGAVKCIGYNAGFTDEQVEWLKQDLAAVKDPHKKVAVLCVHVPIKSSTAKNFQAIAVQLTQFNEAHILSGHSHHLVNHIHSNKTCKGGSKIYEHNLQAVAGSWWNSNLSPDGTPMGYAVYRFAGNKLFDSLNKATGASSNLQIRVYNGNDTYNGYTEGRGITGKPSHNETFAWGDDYKGKFIARVWDADSENWTVEFVQNGKAVPMERVTLKDECTGAFNRNIINRIYGTESSYYPSRDCFWVADAPGGDPATEKDWEIVAKHKMPTGWTQTYTCKVLQRDYTGFASGDKFPENN